MNKLTSLEGIEELHSLDILDAPANRIECIPQLVHLNSLRMMNLSGEPSWSV